MNRKLIKNCLLAIAAFITLYYLFGNKNETFVSYSFFEQITETSAPKNNKYPTVKVHNNHFTYDITVNANKNELDDSELNNLFDNIENKINQQVEKTNKQKNNTN